ncbi:exosome complex component MTR3-like [Elysia marginata]|uniref:Exosome complex component MTR3-like n=1 Tax=Elysia marginata TaxID=1093978 RepID=A0AAV4I7V8_9GAST|nr:exosome complex component MTR3-like [Elysia marginata]
MPTDTRRLTGPESSQSPYNFAPATKLDLSNLESRPDGRKAHQLRPLFLRTDVISQARGSSYIEMNETKAICAVYGPREVLRREDFSLKGQLTCEFKFTTFSCKKRRQHQQDSQEKDLSVHVLEALEPAVCLHKYPKSQINIFITVLQHDGSAQEEQAILKSTVKPAEASVGCVTVAFLPSLSQVSAISSDGDLSFESLNKTMQACVTDCQRLYPVLEHALVKHQQDTEAANR